MITNTNVHSNRGAKMKKLWIQNSYVIILIILSFVTAFVLAFQFDSFKQNKYIEVTVMEGDSIWKIADDYSDMHSLSNEQFVHWVERHNSIEGDLILPGDKVIIPVKNQSESINEFASAAQE